MALTMAEEVSSRITVSELKLIFYLFHYRYLEMLFDIPFTSNVYEGTICYNFGPYKNNSRLRA